jgi:hypothetical protein
MNPETGMVFTEVSAWEFVACLLECGHPLQEKCLRKPPDKLAFEMLVALEEGKPDLYIKLHPHGGGRVYGRSFHYSTK